MHSFQSEAQLQANTVIINSLQKCIQHRRQQHVQRDAQLVQIVSSKMHPFTALANTPSDSSADEDIVVVSVTRHKIPDCSLQQINSIRRRRKQGVLRVKMHPLDVPRYDAWVPVIQNHFVLDSDIEPFRPYFGDQRTNLEQAKCVYEQMVDDYDKQSALDCFSDGEIRANRTFAGPSGAKFETFYSLKERRIRAAQRQSILEIVRQYGTHDAIWSALAYAFGMSNIQRIKLIGDLAERRRQESAAIAQRIANSAMLTRTIRERLSAPKDEHFRADGNNASSAPLIHFCFRCHQFACHFHEGENVTPILPIPDVAARERVNALSSGQAAPCSQRCYLLSADVQDAVDADEKRSWSAQEVYLLREATVLMLEDPCNLSIVVGSRSCREVYARMQLPEESMWRRRALEESQRPRVPTPRSPTPLQFSDSDEESIVLKKSLKRARKKKGNRRVLKSVCPAKENESESEQRKDFVPCDHAGACYKRNGCTCMEREIECQPQCACNCGRYVEGEHGIHWEGPSDTDLRQGRAIRCKNRVVGCACKTGHCNTDKCACYSANAACNPDFCVECDCVILPSEISVRERRCRNVDLITSRHKQTFMGHSMIHGLGLFAGEQFVQGDLVGAYCGRVMDAQKIDKVLRESNAQETTYAFNVTENFSIDGGRLGSKAKFINHSKRTSNQNCAARFERVRGEGRICLKATKTIRPGEEFLFDYQVVHGETYGWLNEDASDKEMEEVSARQSQSSSLGGSASSENDYE